ncbi:MAG: acyl-CoA carboxylase subunit epsilon [Jatrophihabitans sp.]|uniref:acyl-CoA carboxylase subunit epsilon n=1 Tax=Jatrophihabitans sp. TaxID=1932789 RepID=UPI003F7EE624
MTAPAEGTGERPVLRIVSGSPTPEELAVLTALVTAAGAGGVAAAPEAPRRGRWNDPARGTRRPLLPGPGAWRATWLA